MKKDAGTYHDFGTVPGTLGDSGNVWRDIVAAIPEVEMLFSRQDLIKRLIGHQADAEDQGRDEVVRMICEDAEVRDAWKALACIVARLDSPEDPELVRLRARDRGWLRGLERMDGREETDDYGVLKRGLRAGKAVGRVLTGDGGIGTGILVAPGLLLTNNHLIGDEAEAEGAVVTFDFELQDNGLPATPAHFHLTIDVFMTSVELDYCFVSVAPVSMPGLSAEPRYLAEFGFSPLAPQSGKTAKKESFNLLHHPDGGLKTMTSKENVVLGYEGDHVYYLAGGQRISFGALVCNPQWHCVALHQMTIPDPQDPSKSIAGRGVRISSILRDVASRRQGGDPDATDVERLMAKGRRSLVLESDRQKLAATPGAGSGDVDNFDDPDDLMHLDIDTEDDDRYYGPESESDDEYYQYEWDDEDDDTGFERADGDNGIRLACLNGRPLNNRS